MSRLYRCEHCGETLSSPSKNYDCPLKPAPVETEAPAGGAGYRHGRQRLSDAEVARIRSDEFAKASLAEIAEVFGITPMYACQIRRGFARK